MGPCADTIGGRVPPARPMIVEVRDLEVASLLKARDSLAFLSRNLPELDTDALVVEVQ